MGKYLYQSVEDAKLYGQYQGLPDYIPQNLNPSFEIRPYQRAAFQNFITYFENGLLCQQPSQTLFHMATGSGKTLIMAGLILYLYQQGYRNFLFFVNLDNIVKKTKDNFLNPASPKYLFADEIHLSGQRIEIREVENFQSCSEESINLCFLTTQKLHRELWDRKENAITLDDPNERKLVLISDEAHHLNADTKSGRQVDEEDLSKSWEYTVSRIFKANPENVLLEFTATCDLENENIRARYEDKIIFDYPLRRFREDLYSKEVKTLQADIPLMDRVIQAIVLSQYRLKVFEEHRLSIKPVVLFKGAKIADSRAFLEEFHQVLAHLSAVTLERIAQQASHPTLQAMYRYFSSRGVTFDMLAQELREAFGPEHCISVNDERDAEEKQIIVNTLEQPSNPYRAVFEVKKLDEGWDVLNLFDIVRLYETRDGKNGRPGKKTVAEAQLIGRGARYCPFVAEEGQSRYQRKYDGDLEHPMRVCEELYYHCQYDHRYISELTAALRETGILAQHMVEVNLQLKQSFMEDELYQKGLVYANRRELKQYSTAAALPQAILDREYHYRAPTGKMEVDTILNGAAFTVDTEEINYHSTTIKDVASVNYAIVHRALRRINTFQFYKLKRRFPGLKSVREFILDEKYLGAVRLVIQARSGQPGPELLQEACFQAMSQVEQALMSSESVYQGSSAFYARPVREVFTGKLMYFTDVQSEGMGVSQRDATIRPEWRLDLSREDWYAYDDCYGTTEEKAFLAYFKKISDRLRQCCDRIWLVRNERQLVLYSFEEGRRIEPDFVLFLKYKEVWYQLFIEIKGNHLLKEDAWKEAFLLEIGRQGYPVQQLGEPVTFIQGLPFYNETFRKIQFKKAMDLLLQ